MRSSDTYIGLVSIGIGAFIWYLAVNLPVIPAYGDVGPAFFPKITSIGLFIVGGSLIILNALKKNAAPKMEEETVDNDQIRKSNIMKAILFIGLTAIYLISWRYCSFILSTAIYFFFSSMLFGNRKLLYMGPFSIVTSLALYIVFRSGLKVPLP